MGGGAMGDGALRNNPVRTCIHSFSFNSAILLQYPYIAPGALPPDLAGGLQRPPDPQLGICCCPSYQNPVCAMLESAAVTRHAVVDRHATAPRRVPDKNRIVYCDISAYDTVRSNRRVKEAGASRDDRLV